MEGRPFADPLHEDPVSHVRKVPFWGFEDYVCLPDGTEAKASVVIPLEEETVELAVDGGANTDLVVAIGNDGEWFGETEYGNRPVFSSPFRLRAADWDFAWWCLTVFLCFSVAHTLSDAIEKLDEYLEPQPKVARLLVADCVSFPFDGVFAPESGCSWEGSPLYCPDIPNGSFTSSGSLELPLEGQADDVSIHRMVEKAISRLERQRAVSVSPELEQCILKSWTVKPQGVVTNPVPVVFPVVADQSFAHQPWQRWALVVYRPEDPNVAYQRVCILLARWRHTVEMAVPVSGGHQDTTVPATEDTAAPEGRRKRKNRAGQAQRRRQGKRKQMEREREERERQEGQVSAL